MKLETYIEKLAEDHKLDQIVRALFDQYGWDKVCLAFSNILCFKSNDCKDKKLAKEYYAQAKMFHKILEDKEQCQNTK